MVWMLVLAGVPRVDVAKAFGIGTQRVWEIIKAYELELRFRMGRELRDSTEPWAIRLRAATPRSNT